jgi:hypothetical protein
MTLAVSSVFKNADNKTNTCCRHISESLKSKGNFYSLNGIYRKGIIELLLNQNSWFDLLPRSARFPVEVGSVLGLWRFFMAFSAL